MIGYCDGGAVPRVTSDPIIKRLGSAVSVSATRGRANHQFKFLIPMATINAHIEVLERKPSKSGWASVKRWWLDLFERFAICGSQQDFDDLAMYRRDEQVRACIRAEMREHVGADRRDTCVANAIDITLRSIGYDLSDLGSIRQANIGVKRTFKEWEAYFKDRDVDPLATCRFSQAQVIPKFAAACALHIRAKLGAMEANEANVLLVQRKYLEVCRRHGVRDVDTVLHQGFVMNAVFTESVLDDLASSRRRLPAWIRWLDEVQPTGSVPRAVC